MALFLLKLSLQWKCHGFSAASLLLPFQHASTDWEFAQVNLALLYPADYNVNNLPGIVSFFSPYPKILI